MLSKDTVICCICNKPIPVKTYFPIGGTWEYGNNADPVAKGRCCDGCDRNVVIPARVVALYMRRGVTREEAQKVAEGVKSALKAMKPWSAA